MIKMIIYKQFSLPCFLFLFLFLTLSIIYYPSLIFSQSNDAPKFQVLKKDMDEKITFPYTALESYSKNPSEYVFKKPILNDWNVFLYNNIFYSNKPEAKP